MISSLPFDTNFPKNLESLNEMHLIKPTENCRMLCNHNLDLDRHLVNKLNWVDIVWKTRKNFKIKLQVKRNKYVSVAILHTVEYHRISSFWKTGMVLKWAKITNIFTDIFTQQFKMKNNGISNSKSSTQNVNTVSGSCFSGIAWFNNFLQHN